VSFRFTDQRRKFYKSDFDKYFAVDYIDMPQDDPDLTAILDKYDITQDEKYAQERVQRNYELYSPYLEKGLPNDQRFYVSFVSPEMGYGLFADVFVPAWTIVGIYAGIITNKITNTDYAWAYQSKPLDEKGEPIRIRINARVSGNMMRFVNHSDNPNCNALHIPYKGRWYVVYVTNQQISIDQELTVNYGEGYWKQRQD
jgi:SET domain-containing protein